ncbi:hypothetical protein [Psychromonas sp. Urea-02u-13]|uniref:hypothetical protein n=1 Tax=Psychromonas sp. Urea-02u-13 TaxID=2058326 RepID=UPI000C345C55|nr:hypothetical protein [Psychromonas sp. Urea-02u-13]PKG38920.1 hypothetical protein CXF74_11220 [Psychromonas sp. Urea-02u-13]
MSINNLEVLLNKTGNTIDKQRNKNRIKFTTKAKLEKLLPKNAGLYWIETNMPDDEIIKNIKSTSDKVKKVRVTKPEGFGFCKVQEDGCRVIYSGTQANIKKRLFEHLFNDGSKDTAKLGCNLESKECEEYEWFISYHELEDTTIRYAIESWWRINIGWPKFCIR